MYQKLFNNTSVDFKFRFQDTVVVVPPNEFVVVSDAVAEHARYHYATLEISEATEQEYKDYRLAKDKKEAVEKKRLASMKKIEDKKAEQEVEVLALKQERAKEKIKLLEKKEKIRLGALIAEEQKVISELSKTDEEREKPIVEVAAKVKKVKKHKK